MTAVRAVRNRRAEMNVPPSKKARLDIVTKEKELFSDGAKFFQRLASASSVAVSDDENTFDLASSVSVVTEIATIYLPIAELVDFEAEKKRLNKELEEVEKKLAQINGKLNNQGFLAKAPEKVIEEQKVNQVKLNEKAELLKASIAKLG